MSTPDKSTKSPYAKPHSPLPWKSHALMVESQDGNQIAHCTRWYGQRPEPYEAEANAEFIVRACNAHDELIEILKTWTHDGALQTFESRERFRIVALAAIAKAEGR